MSTIEKIKKQVAALYDLGFSLIPLQYKDKRPLIRSWEPYKTTRATREQVDQWFSELKNVGIVTGKVSGIVVLDIDGMEGSQALEAMESMHGKLPPTFQVATGKGRHYYFKYPDGFEIRNKADARLKIDVRADGGYVVGPPSVHPNGGTYQFVHDASITEPADLPKWLFLWMQGSTPPEWMPVILHDLGFTTEKKRIEKYFSSNDDKNKNIKIEKYIGVAGAILKNCAFCQHCEKNANILTEPEWHAMVTNVGRADGGPELVHELSKPYAGYNENETQLKIERALEKGEPHTCEYIQTRIGFGGCPSDGCGVKAPVVFATSEIHIAKNKIIELERKESLKPSDVFDGEIIGALATIKRRDPAEWSLTKIKLKEQCKELNLRDLDSAVKVKQAEQIQLRVAERVEMSAKESEEMTVDFGFVVTQPEGWIIRQSGVYQLNEEHGDRRVVPVPVFLTKRIINADTGEEKIEISFKRDGDWRKISASRGVAFNRSQIVSLANHALPISSENARELIQYLSDFEASNLDTVPISRAVTRMGWISQSAFIPGAAGDIELDVDPGMAAIASGYTPTGQLDEWTSVMREVRSHPIARMMMAASFAAPMLRLVGHRVFLLHVWGPSRGGKTAALKAALSVWGDPDALMASFNSTKVGLERLAAFYSDLPLGIDERQIVGNRQDFVENLVYLIGMGKGKTRGAKGGGLQAAQNWRTIAMTTGEEPLSNESSNTGIKTRAIELYGQPFSDEALAARVHAVTRDHHGLAGATFVRSLIQCYGVNREQFKDAHQSFSDEIQNKFPKHMGSTISQLAMLALGDFYASREIFGLSLEQSVNESLELIYKLGATLETDHEADEAIRGAQQLKSWCLSNKNTFDENVMTRTGYISEGTFYIYSHRFDAIMKELNFNSSRMLRDWSKLGFILTQNEGDRIRYRVKKWDTQNHMLGTFVGFNGPKESKLDVFE